VQKRLSLEFFSSDDPALPFPECGETMSRQGSSIEEQQKINFGLVKFYSKLFCLAAIVASIVGSIVLLVPDENDYSQASVLKHERLAQLPSPKIVLVGGSNLAFGVDSQQIEQALDCQVVNMGMNGWLGIRFMLEEVRGTLKAGDTVVLSFEWDNFFKPVEGHGPSFLGIIKTNPGALSFLTIEQLKSLLVAFSEVAQEKTERLIKQALTSVGIRKQEPSAREQRGAFLNTIEALEGFSPHGDLVSHLSVETPLPFPLGQDLIQKGTPVEKKAIEMMVEFAKEMTSRKIHVLVSYPPIPPDVFQRHSESFNDIHRVLSLQVELSIPRPPTELVFDRENFFDTIYHLNRYGRPLRTKKMIEDLSINSSCSSLLPRQEIGRP
jgi:hypothetical protein